MVDELQSSPGSSNPGLSKEILDKLGVPEKDTLQVKRFADGEIYVKILDTVRGKDVYVIQATSPPVNDNLMELLLVVSTARRASAKRITAIIPYYGCLLDRSLDRRLARLRILLFVYQLQAQIQWSRMKVL